MKYLALDVGASSGKMFVGTFANDRLSLQEIHRFKNAAIKKDGSLFWDFDAIYSNMLNGIRKAYSQTNEVKSFGVDSFSNDYSFIDSAGQIISPMFCYRDSRTARCADDIFKIISPEEVYALSGNQIALFTTFMQLASMRIEKRDELLDKAHTLLFLPDLLCYGLTGNVACEYTIATVSQLFDYPKNTWNDKLLSSINIPRSLMPDIAASGSVLGTARVDDLHDFSVVSVCEHDTASAYLAAGASKDSAIISSGTWALVGIENEDPIINDISYKYNIANEGSLKGKHRLLKNVMGSWLLQKLIEAYEAKGVSLDFSHVSLMAEKAKPFAFLIDPDAPAFFAPDDILAAIRENGKGSHIPETPAEFARCIYDSLAFKYRWCIEKLELLANRKIGGIRIVGGGSKDAVMNQLISNASGRCVYAGCADASAAGNVLVQMMASNQISNLTQLEEVAKRSFDFVIYEPQGSDQHDEWYGKYTQMFQLD